MSECKFVRLGTVHGKSQAPKLPEKSWDSSIPTGCNFRMARFICPGSKKTLSKGG